jgi:DNA-directed RNA polymerase subunit M/transcription elongation factor TFIIS
LWQQTRPEAILNINRPGYTREEYQARYQAALSAIRDLIFDYEMGKISAEDYEKLLAKTKFEAAEIRHQLDRVSRSATTDIEATLDVEIEKLVAQLRHNKFNSHTPLLSEVEAEIELLKQIQLTPAQMEALVCPQCGQALLPDDTFCVICGQMLSPLPSDQPGIMAQGCPSCGYAFQAGDAFCARCGLALADRAQSSQREEIATG